MRHNVTLSIAATLLVAIPAYGQNPVREGRQVSPAREGRQVREQIRERTGTREQSRGKAAVNDRLFAAAAAEAGLAELSLSELGAQRATDPELKRFSEKMIEEHTRLNAELKSLAGQKGLALPTQVGYCAQFCAQSLAGLSGEEFDKYYAKAQFLAHMEAMGLFEAEAERGADRDVAALASKALEHVKEHLRMIKLIAKKYMQEDGSESIRESGGIRNTKPSN